MCCGKHILEYFLIDVNSFTEIFPTKFINERSE
nr:MAG TPA: hypothetical protein [Caudoviricetes sp.]